MSELYKNIEMLCKEKNINITQMCKEANVSRGTLTDLKKGRSGSLSASSIQKISAYFGVTTDYLLKEEKKTYKVQDLIFMGDLAPKPQKELNIKIPKELTIVPPTQTYNIPIYESVAAGFGTSAIDYIVGYMPMFIKNPADAENMMCIKVQGDSMFPKIENGDTIAVLKQDSVDSGTIAVVLIDGEDGLVKKVTYGADWIELISINPMYPPMRFEGAEVQRIRVVGRVTQIIKNV